MADRAVLVRMSVAFKNIKSIAIILDMMIVNNKPTVAIMVARLI